MEQQVSTMKSTRGKVITYILTFIRNLECEPTIREIMIATGCAKQVATTCRNQAREEAPPSRTQIKLTAVLSPVFRETRVSAF